MLTTFARMSVTILRPGWSLDHGESVADWSDPTRIAAHRCALQPQLGTETTTHRDEVQRLWTLYLPLDADLRATDRVEFAGDVYEVVGQPQQWRGPSALDHQQATLQRWEG